MAKGYAMTVMYNHGNDIEGYYTFVEINRTNLTYFLVNDWKKLDNPDPLDLIIDTYYDPNIYLLHYNDQEKFREYILIYRL